MLQHLLLLQTSSAFKYLIAIPPRTAIQSQMTYLQERHKPGATEAKSISNSGSQMPLLDETPSL